MVTGISH